MTEPAPDSTLVRRGPRGRRAVVVAAARAIVGIALVGVLVAQVRRDTPVVQSVGRALGAVAAAVVLLTLAQFLSALRWRAVLGGQAPPIAYLFRLCLIGQCVGLFLPTSVGGDALRIAALGRVLPRAADAAWSVVADRVLGVGALGMLLAVGLATVDGVPLPALSARVPAAAGPAALALALVVVLVGGVLAARTSLGVRMWRRARAEVARVAAGLARRPASVWARWLGLALVVQLTYLATWVAIAAIVRLPIPFMYFFVAVPLTSLAAMLPITIAGLGVREGAWAALLAPLGIAAGDAVASSLLYFAGFAITGALGGGWFAWRGTSLTVAPAVSADPAPPLNVQPATSA